MNKKQIVEQNPKNIFLVEICKSEECELEIIYLHFFFFGRIGIPVC